MVADAITSWQQRSWAKMLNNLFYFIQKFFLKKEKCNMESFINLICS